MTALTARFWVALLPLVMQPAVHAQRRYPLPEAAKIAELKPGVEATEQDAEACRGFRMMALQVRRRFRTYHAIEPAEAHAYYLWFPCFVEGKIFYHGKAYTFKANAAHTLWTDWPDGVQKQLGGVHDDDPSGR